MTSVAAYMAKKGVTRKRVKVYGALATSLLLLAGISYLAYQYNQWSQEWSWHLQNPIRNYLVIEPVVSQSEHKTIVKEAKAIFDPQEELKKKIRAKFGEDTNTMLAIATAESGLNAGNKGYNCKYGNESKACKPEDRQKAWSVDCGLLQINVIGKSCPAELFDVDTNINEGYRKFKSQGFKAWSVYKNGSYKNHLLN